MKTFNRIAILFILAFQLKANASDDLWLCEADCGGVKLELSLAYEALIPVYYGGPVFGEGSTITEAYNNMKKKCSSHIHKGFTAYSIRLITLNKRFSVTEICRR